MSTFIPSVISISRLARQTLWSRPDSRPNLKHTPDTPRSVTLDQIQFPSGSLAGPETGLPAGPLHFPSCCRKFSIKSRIVRNSQGFFFFLALRKWTVAVSYSCVCVCNNVSRLSLSFNGERFKTPFFFFCQFPLVQLQGPCLTCVYYELWQQTVVHYAFVIQRLCLLLLLLSSRAL